MHLAAIILIAIAIAVIMTPAAYHRQVEPGSVSEQFVKLASRLVTAAMVPLMLGLCLDVYLLAPMILGGSAISMAIATGLLALFGTLWFVFPQIMRRARGMER